MMIHASVPSSSSDRSANSPRRRGAIRAATFAARVALSAFALSVFAGAVRAGEPSLATADIFPLEHWHNHGSCIVEAPNGDLIVCWFHGSGERTADDVAILGARKRKGVAKWSEPFVMADVPGFPDTNCCMIVDPKGRLWLFWPTILAHTWESALLKYRISSDYYGDGPPKWETSEVLHMKPSDDFAEQVKAKGEAYMGELASNPLAQIWLNRVTKMAEDKLTRRIGWFTRAHPYIVDGERLLVGLYSDGFSFSLATWTDDWGANWSFSDPIVGGGNIQPAFARKKDGTIVAYMRDNGPPPKRVMVSESKDRGETWGQVYDHPLLPNSGTGVEVANLRSGEWICINNDTESGRHSLAVSISDDEGATWKWTRHLEYSADKSGRYHYPSILEAADGTLHASYSVFVPNPDGKGEGKTIRHAAFNAEWVKAGDPTPIVP